MASCTLTNCSLRRWGHSLLIYLLSLSLLYFLSTGGMTSTVLLSTFSMCCLGHSNKNLFLVTAHINFCTLEIIALSHILARSMRSAACIHISKDCEGSEHGNLLNGLRAYSWNIIKRSIFPLQHTKLFFDFDNGVKSSFAILVKSSTKVILQST